MNGRSEIGQSANKSTTASSFAFLRCNGFPKVNQIARGGAAEGAPPLMWSTVSFDESSTRHPAGARMWGALSKAFSVPFYSRSITPTSLTSWLAPSSSCITYALMKAIVIPRPVLGSSDVWVLPQGNRDVAQIPMFCLRQGWPRL